MKIPVEGKSTQKGQAHNFPNQKIEFRTDCHFLILLCTRGGVFPAFIGFLKLESHGNPGLAVMKLGIDQNRSEYDSKSPSNNDNRIARIDIHLDCPPFL